MRTQYPTSDIRTGPYALSDAELEIAALIHTAPQELQRLLRARFAYEKRLRSVGCHKFSHVLDGGTKLHLKSGDTISESYYQQNQWVGIKTDPMGPPIRDVLLSHFAILGSKRWGARFYRSAGVTARNMTISGVEEEHGWYANISKTADPSTPAIWWDKVLVENVGSQVGQFAYRPHETSDPEGDKDPDTGPLKFTNSLFRNFHLTTVEADGTLTGGTRPAQTLQCKATPNDVLIDSCIWDNTAVPLSFGCLMVQGFSTEKDKLKNDGSLIDIDASHRKVYMNNSEMWTAPSQQKPMWFTDLASVWIEGGHFESQGGKEPILDIERCKRVHIKGASGNLRVRIDGKDVGRIDKDYDHKWN